MPLLRVLLRSAAVIFTEGTKNSAFAFKDVCAAVVAVDVSEEGFGDPWKP